MIDYFEILRIPPDADTGRVRAGYEQLVAAHDRGDPDLPSRAMIDEAFAVLSDDTLRARYVRLRSGDPDSGDVGSADADADAAKNTGPDVTMAAGLVGGGIVGGGIAAVAALIIGGDPLIGGGVGLVVGAAVGAVVRP